MTGTTYDDTDATSSAWREETNRYQNAVTAWVSEEFGEIVVLDRGHAPNTGFDPDETNRYGVLRRYPDTGVITELAPYRDADAATAFAEEVMQRLDE